MATSLTSDSVTPGTALQSCINAISNKDLEAVVNLTDSLALFEIPMLKPNRLHGHDEIRCGLEAAFGALGTINFSLDNEPAESGTVAIAAGSLSVTRTSGSDEEHTVGLVVETRRAEAGSAEGQSIAIVRFSLYLNARNQRLWSDAAIL